jgi:hypothetical protein
MRKLLSIILLLFVIITNAQVVKDTTIVNTDLLLGVNLSGGNKPLYGGNIKANLSVIHNAWETNISPSFTLNYITDTNGDLLVQRRELYNSLSVSHILSNKWKLIGFSEFDNSFLQKIDMRFNAGVGTGFRYKTDKGEIHISEVFLAERLNSKVEQINDYFVVRASTRVKLVCKTKFCTITSVHLIQPAIYTDQDISKSKHMIYRTNSKIDFNVSNKVTTGFTYDTIYQGYTSYMLGSVKPFDWNSSFFISYKL